MAVYLSSDALDRATEQFQTFRLRDKHARAAFDEAVSWLAARLFKTPAYRIVFALCRELARLDDTVSYPMLSLQRPSSSLDWQWLLTDLRSRRDALWNLTRSPQTHGEHLAHARASELDTVIMFIPTLVAQTAKVTRHTTLAAEPTLHDTEELFTVLAMYPKHLKTAATLAQAAMAYYKEHGQPLPSGVPRGVLTPTDTCAHGVQMQHACPQCVEAGRISRAERADAQRVVE